MVETLLDALRDNFSWNRRQHLVAAWTLGQTPLKEAQRLEAIQNLVRMMSNRDGSQIRRIVYTLTRFTVFFGAVCILIASCFLISSAISSISWLPDFVTRSAGNLAAAICSLVGFFGFVLLNIVDDNTIQTVAIDSLGGIGGAESVGPLAIAAHGFNQSISRSAQLALLKVLTDLRLEERKRINSAGRNASAMLLEAMYSARYDVADDRLCLQMLLLLRDIGGGEAIYPVEKIARSDQSPSRRQLATQILPLLRSRSQQEQNAAALLRVADDDPTNTLLRPAVNSTRQTSDDLLRIASPTPAEMDVSNGGI